jgi:hypothetical protein
MTLGEVLTTLAIALVLAGTFIFMLPHMRTKPIRFVCASNLGQLGRALYTYGNENRDMWPIAAHAEAQDEGMGRVTYAPGKIGVKRMGVAGTPSRPSESQPGEGGSTTSDTQLSTTRNLWLLVRMRVVTPTTFNCPNDDWAQRNDEDNPQDYFDFRKYTETSYGYQVPYGRKGRPSSDLDQRMPVVADKGPFGAALEAGQTNPGVPALLPIASPDDWRKWNSPNHGSDGQVVLFADAHAEFLTRPVCGIKDDNIYTRWADARAFLEPNQAARAHGIPPTGRETPWSNTDTLIYP